ncbi:hypothetical protein GN316_13895 [Xylophilus sp. Kf1]|nr:hypothetical protein [Xylophilus sp. Kf1]
MLPLFSGCVSPSAAPLSPTVPTAGPSAPPGSSRTDSPPPPPLANGMGDASGRCLPAGLSDLPPEWWWLTGRHLVDADRAAFFGAHPGQALGGEAQVSAMLAAIGATRDGAVVARAVAQASGLPAVQGARLMVRAVQRGCRRLHACGDGPQERVLQRLLESCLDHADRLPPLLRHRVLAALLLRLPHPYCGREAFETGRHGAFATRLVTGLLAAAGAGDSLVCRAVARSERGLARLIDLEHGVGPGLGHQAERAHRAAEFLAVLGRPETVARGDAGAALATASSLVSYFLQDRITAHLPLLRRLVAASAQDVRTARSGARGDNGLGLQYLAEIVDQVSDPGERAALMGEMVAAMRAGARARGTQAMHDAVAALAQQLRRPMEALDAPGRASVEAALRAAGHSPTAP